MKADIVQAIAIAHLKGRKEMNKSFLSAFLALVSADFAMVGEVKILVSAILTSVSASEILVSALCCLVSDFQ